MLLPRTAEYALRSVLYVATVHPRAVPVSELADAVEAPRNYLAKTLNHLARDGVLAATRGPGGGYRMGVAPDALTLGDIIARFATGMPRRCLLRPIPCGSDPTCAVHERWQPAAAAIDEFFTTTTVADLLAERSALAVQPSSPLVRSR